MLKIRAFFLSCLFALTCIGAAWPQDASQQTGNGNTQGSTPSQDQTPAEPQLSPVPSVTTSLPPGTAVYKAACLVIGNQGTVVGPAYVAGPCYKQQGQTLVPDFTINVSRQEDIASQLSSIGTQTDSNNKLVQQAVLNAIVKVLSDQSLKADQVAAVVKTASDQIVNDLTAKLEKNLAALVQKEVAKQIKAGADAPARKTTSVKSVPDTH